MNWLFFVLGMLTQHCLVMIIGRHIHNKRQKAIRDVIQALSQHPDRLPHQDELPDNVTGIEVEVYDSTGRKIEIGSPEYSEAVNELGDSQEKNE